MATIGLDRLYYAPITEDATGKETYGTPIILSPAISVDLSPEANQAILYADDRADSVIDEFKGGKLTLGVKDIGATVAADLTGATIDANGAVISAGENGGSPVAILFRAQTSSRKYRYYVLYRVVFGIPKATLATKGDSITFQTPTIEGTISTRNKVDAFGNHPWKAEIDEDGPDVTQTVIDEWFTEVYEPEA